LQLAKTLRVIVTWDEHHLIEFRFKKSK